MGVAIFVATPDTATLTISTEPSVSSASRSRTLPTKKLGCSRAGSSKTATRAVRIPDSQPSPE